MRRFFAAGIFVLLSFLSCSRQPGQAADRAGAFPDQNSPAGDSLPLIAVSIPPQAWFVHRIAGERAASMVLAGPGQNPHSYEPSPKQMKDLSAARAWILSGTEFEISLRPKIEKLFPNLRIVDGTAGVEFRSLEEHDDEWFEDETGADSNTDHGIDRHTWLGCGPAKILAAHIRDTLSLVDPPGAEQYAERCYSLLGEIDDEFAALRLELAPLKGRSVFVYHPSFGYFLDEFQIRQEAVEAGGKEPGPRELGSLIARAKAENAAAIFVQAQFPVNAAKTLAAATGAELVSLDPLAFDWLVNIRIMGRALQKAVSVPAFRAGEGR